MTAPYLQLPGAAREALAFYADVFGAEVQLHTFAEFGRADGPADAVAHGYLTGGAVEVFAADTSGDQMPLRCEGLLLALLGADEPDVLRGWFAKLSAGGTVLDDLQERPWGAWDGQVKDRFGLTWLIGFELP